VRMGASSMCAGSSYQGGWTGHIALTGQMGNAYSILVGKPEGKRLDRQLLASQEVT